MNWIGYLILGIYIAIIFWTILMGIDKMSRVIVGNYIVGITCFAFGNLINQISNWLLNTPNSLFMGVSYAKYASFLSSGQLTFILLLYAGLIRLIYSCGRIQINFSNQAATEKLYFILLIPITILSFIVGPHIALTADGIQVLNFIQTSLTKTFGFLYDFIKNIPLIMLLNGIAFIIVSSHINFKISISAKATKLPDGL